jgi:uncharacterized hydrophobic protein (TIGR00271 family)
MVVAGVIAAFGIMGGNDILIIGAMAASPDLLPVTAACVWLVGGRPRLALLATSVLVVGLAAAVLAAFALTVLLLATGWLEPGFRPPEDTLGTLITLDVSSAIIAFAAGIAAMLTFESRASGVVGVAISVTTIPAAVFLGIALATGAPGAASSLAVLVLNVLCILVGGSLTLSLQARARPGLPG